MPSFARELEQTLHNALGEASRRRHEYATLEHLLIALVDDEHASKVMAACLVSRDELSRESRPISTMAGALVATRPAPTADHGFQRVVQARILHVQSSGATSDGAKRPRRSVLRARKLCGLFPPAAGMSRSIGDLHQPRRGKATRGRNPRRRAPEEKATRAKAEERALKQSPSTSTRRPPRASRSADRGCPKSTALCRSCAPLEE